MSEAAAASLPNDIIFDILSRTPVRSVWRLRCVSRAWRALVSDPAFLAAHKSRHTEPLLVDTGTLRGDKRRDIRIRDMDGNVVRVIEGVGGCGVFGTTSLDDLVCIVNFSYDGSHVVDPATGAVLASCPGIVTQVRARGNHPFRVTHYYTTYGFGRATPSDAYKMVRLSDAGACDILTVEDGAGWRMARARPSPDHAPNCYLHPATVNGIMYFLTQGNPPDGTLICFDLKNEQWKDEPIEGPKKVGGAKAWERRTISVNVTELNGALCMVQVENDGGSWSQPYSCTTIWILDGSGKSTWTKAYTIPKGLTPYECHYRPLRVMHDGERLLVQSVARYTPWRSALQVYDPRTETCKDVEGAPASRIGLCNLHLEHLVAAKS